MLYVDIGNSTTIIKDINGNEIISIPPKTSVLVSSVNTAIFNDFTKIHKDIEIFIPDINLLPLNFSYNGKLGIDRCVVAIPFLGETCYIVDVGSMITIDKLDNFNFYPGPIIPGYDIIKQTVFEKIDGIKENAGKDTLNNLQKGICEIIKCSVKQFITEPLPVYITGGNADCFSNETNLLIKKDLIFEGLKIIGENGWYKRL